MSSLGCSGGGGTGGLKTGKRDVAFLLDSSASLRESNFMSQKNIVKQVIRDIYPVSVDGNRIGVIRYSDDAKIEVNFNEYFTNKDLYTSVDSIPFTRGGSRIDKALKLARDQLFTVANGARNDAEKVMPFICDAFKGGLGSSVPLPKIFQNFLSPPPKKLLLELF